MAEIQKKVSYTDFAKRIGIEGSVVIQAVIDKNGNVVNAIVQKSLFADLDQISLEAVKSTMFKPGKQRGKPVNVQISIPIIFKLR
jgi:protein TonB